MWLDKLRSKIFSKTIAIIFAPTSFYVKKTIETYTLSKDSFLVMFQPLLGYYSFLFLIEPSFGSLVKIYRYFGKKLFFGVNPYWKKKRNKKNDNKNT